MRAHIPYDWANAATLAANRAGKLTDEQRKLVGEPVHWGCLLLGSAMMFAGCPGLAVVAAHNGHFSDFLFVAFSFVIVIAIVAALVGANRVRGRARDDVVAGRIVEAQGQVVWDGVRYSARVQGRRLRPPRRRALPAPGPYNFVYLARSGVLLAAEPLRELRHPVGAALPGGASGGGSKLARQALGEALARTLRFSSDDLAANRLGRLSAAQRRKLWIDAIDTFFGTLGGVAGALALVLGGLAAATYTIAPRIFPGQTAVFSRLAQGQHMSPALLLEGALALLVPLVLIGGVAAFLAARPVVRDVRGGYAAAIDGEVDGVVGMIRAARVYYYIVRTKGAESERRRMRFVVSPLAYRALVGGQPYRLYYLPHLHTLLSIEPLAPPVSPAS